MVEIGDPCRVAGRPLVAGLCDSAAAAIVALVPDAWSDLSWSVVGTNLGFSVFARDGGA